MHMKRWMGAIALGVMITATAANAQTVDQRHRDQQHRVAQGERSGQITRKEYNHIERQQASIDRQEANMRYHHFGRLTSRDRAILQHRENKASTRIYRDKHNYKVQ